MEKLKGPEALNVIIKKFSDSCGVVKCVIDFFKSIASAEETYAASISRLTKNGIPFRSTIFMRLFEMEPHQELQSLKQGWETLGSQLKTLAEHHKEKATNYLTKVRQPLLDLLPKLEERKRKLVVETAELTKRLEAAKKKHILNKKRYNELGNRFQKMDQDLEKARKNCNTKLRLQLEPKVLTLSSDVRQQQERYRQSVRELHQEQAAFDASVIQLTKNIQEEEIRRIKAISDSMREFTRILSNTCPIYLSGMQYITLSLEEISAEMDIEGFAEKHQELMKDTDLPEFELHPFMAQLNAPPLDTPLPNEKKNATKLPEVWHKEEEGKPDEEPLDPPPNSTTPTTPIQCEVEVHPQTESHKPPSDPGLASSKQVDDMVPEATMKATMEGDDFRLPKSPNEEDTGQSKSEEGVSGESRGNVKTGDDVPGEGAVAMATTTEVGSIMNELLATLKQQATDNDYYGLLGASAASTGSELAQCRRDRSQELHPDHFVNDPERRKIAEAQLSQINLAYTNVLKQENTRSLYNQLCKFRKGYSKFPNKSENDLKVAKEKLTQLQKSLKRSGSPSPLLREIDSALELINRRLFALEQSEQ